MLGSREENPQDRSSALRLPGLAWPKALIKPQNSSLVLSAEGFLASLAWIWEDAFEQFEPCHPCDCDSVACVLSFHAFLEDLTSSPYICFQIKLFPTKQENSPPSLLCLLQDFLDLCKSKWYQDASCPKRPDPSPYPPRHSASSQHSFSLSDFLFC